MIRWAIVRLLAAMADRWDVNGNPHPESLDGQRRRIASNLRKIARDIEAG